MVLLYSEITGAEFNTTYNNVKLYKFMYDDLTHYGFSYKIGLNIDFRPFNPTGRCLEGGLYFCEESKCHEYCFAFGTKLAYVTVPNDAKVYIENDQFKADKLIITDIVDFECIPDKFWIMLLEKHSFALKYIKKQTNEMCEKAVKRTGYAIEFVHDQTEEISRLALEQNADSIRYIRRYNNVLISEKCNCH